MYGNLFFQILQQPLVCIGVMFISLYFHNSLTILEDEPNIAVGLIQY